MKISSFESQQLPVEKSRSGVDGYWKAAHYEPKIGYQCDIVCTHQPCHALKFIQSFQTIGHTKAHTTYTLSFITSRTKLPSSFGLFSRLLRHCYLLFSLMVQCSMSESMLNEKISSHKLWIVVVAVADTYRTTGGWARCLDASDEKFNRRRARARWRINILTY